MSLCTGINNVTKLAAADISPVIKLKHKSPKKDGFTQVLRIITLVNGLTKCHRGTKDLSKYINWH